MCELAEIPKDRNVGEVDLEGRIVRSERTGRVASCCQGLAETMVMRRELFAPLSSEAFDDAL